MAILWSQGRLGQQVSGKLLDREPVERLVVVEGRDDPVAPLPHVSAAVDVETVRVGVTGQVQPLHRHAFAVVRGVEQAVDLLLVGVRAGVGEELPHIGGLWRQARQIETQSAQQGSAIRLLREPQLQSPQPPQHERVDLVGRPACLDDVRDRRPHRGLKGPVRCPLGASVDPASDRFHLVRRGVAVRRWRRHARYLLRVAHPLEEPAGLGVARDDHLVAAAVGERAFTGVEPQVGLPGVGIRAMAGKAVVRQDRPHVLLEVNVRCIVEGGQGGQRSRGEAKD